VQLFSEFGENPTKDDSRELSETRLRKPGFVHDCPGPGGDELSALFWVSEKFCLDSLLHELVMFCRAKLERTTVELCDNQTSLAKLSPAMLSRKTTQLRQFHPLNYIERTQRDIESFN
jgi:hypothetical protein